MITLTPDTTPVLLIIFNRPEKVERLIAALSSIKPKYIYIAADGPRTHVPSDIERCTLAREIATAIPWDCEVTTHFQTQNLGCRRGVSTAISWFFSKVEMGIILEDDCLPTTQFFAFSSELLERYQQDNSVMHISGTTFLEPYSHSHAGDSYWFSTISLIWGWATWRRAWEKYDLDMQALAETSTRTQALTHFGSRMHARFWLDLFHHIKYAKIDTWDAQWLYTIMVANGQCITPATNLIENIGFDSDATHTHTKVMHARLPSPLLFPLMHPKHTEIDRVAESAIMRRAFINSCWNYYKNLARSLILPL